MQKAQDDLADTIVYAPMSGRLGLYRRQEALRSRQSGWLTSAVRKITLGEKIGSYYMVKSGLKADGLTNLRDGMPLEVTQVTAREMDFSFSPSEKIFDAEKNANS